MVQEYENIIKDKLVESWNLNWVYSVCQHCSSSHSFSTTPRTSFPYPIDTSAVRAATDECLGQCDATSDGQSASSMRRRRRVNLLRGACAHMLSSNAATVSVLVEAHWLRVSFSLSIIIGIPLELTLDIIIIITILALVAVCYHRQAHRINIALVKL